MSRFLTIPQEPLARFRLLSAGFAATIAFFNVALFLFSSTVDQPMRFAAGAASALLGLWWLFGQRRGGFPAVGWLIDAALITIIASVSPMPLRAVGLFYAGIQFRALYVARRGFIWLPVSYMLARVASLLVSPPDPQLSVGSLTLVVQILALTVIAVTLHLFVEATQRHTEIEHELKRSDERYQLVAGAMRDVVYDWNVTTNSIEWTESMRSVFGFAPEMVGRELSWWLDRVHPSDREQLERSVTTTLTNPAASMGTVRYRVRRADDSYAHVSASVIVQRTPEGLPSRVMGSIRDITSEQQLEEQLRQSQKMEAVGQLAGGVAHDFNNLLTVIGGHVFMLEHHTPRTPLSQNHLGGISRAADRAAALTKQLLAFSRKQLLTLSVVDVNAAVDDAVQMMRPVIGEDLQIVTRLDSQLSPVFADAVQLGQVLVNLALNARDAMPGGGTLTIETQHKSIQPRSDDATATPLPAGDYVQLTMRDTGVGMNAQTLARAFEPFFTTKPQGRGSGLGLATVYGIVKQFFGDIQATSAPGAGSCFTILLPVARNAALPPSTPLAPSETAPRAQRERSVLLVEDDDGVREFAREVLARSGYHVHTARNGIEALDQMHIHDLSIDVLVTDVVMPEMGGPELVENIRRHRPGLPVLFITGYTDDSRMLGELHATDSRLLEKPFTASALARVVEELGDAASRSSVDVTLV